MSPERNPASKIRPASPEEIASAARRLGEGAIVAMPTDTVYGIAADALDKYAIARLYEIKGRPKGKPLVILVDSLKTAKKIAPLGPIGEKLARRFWPGALTLVVPRFPACPLPEIVTAGFKTIALRVPAHNAARALLSGAHGPIAVTSANRSGEPEPVTAGEVEATLGPDVDLILDGGKSDIGTVSTVLDITKQIPKILRKGAISQKQLENFLGLPVAGAAT